MIKYTNKNGEEKIISEWEYLQILLEIKKTNTDDVSTMFVKLATKINKSTKFASSTEHGMIEYFCLLNNGTMLLELELYGNSGYVSLRGEHIKINDNPRFVFRISNFSKPIPSLDYETINILRMYGKIEQQMEIDNFKNDGHLHITDSVWDSKENSLDNKESEPTTFHK